MTELVALLLFAALGYLLGPWVIVLFLFVPFLYFVSLCRGGGPTCADLGEEDSRLEECPIGRKG